MFSRKQRLALIAVVLVIGGLELHASRTRIAVALFVVAAILVWAHFRSGPVWLAFRNLRAGNRARARQLIQEVRRPTWLGYGQRAYFELLSGAFAAEDEEYERAEAHLRACLEHRPRTPDARSMVEASLAEVLLELDRKPEARELLESARSRPHRPELDAALEKVRAKIEE